MANGSSLGLPDDAQAAKDAFLAHVRECFESFGLTYRAFGQKYGIDHSMVHRYINGQSMPRKRFIDMLVAELEAQAPAPLTAERRHEPYRLYRAALATNRNYFLHLEVFDLETGLAGIQQELEELAAEHRRLLTEHTALQHTSGSHAATRRGELEQQLQTITENHTRLAADRERLVAELTPRQQTLDMLEATPPGTPILPISESPRPVAPPQQRSSPPGRPRKFPRWGMALIALASAGALVLIGVQLGGSNDPSNDRKDLSTSAPSTTPVTTPATQPSTTPPSSAAAPSPSYVAGAYADRKLTLAQARAGCGLSVSIDLDTPAVHAPGKIGGDDIWLSSDCDGDGFDKSGGQFLGLSSSTKPTPEQCADDARSNPLAGGTPAKDVQVNQGICAITRGDAIVWMKVISKVRFGGGSNDFNFTLQATQWKPAGQ